MKNVTMQNIYIYIFFFKHKFLVFLWHWHKYTVVLCCRYVH